MNCLNIFKMHSQFVSYLGFCSTEKDQTHNRATLHVAYHMLSMPCLLMPWLLKSPGHQQTWYWPNKLEYSVSSIRRLNECQGPCFLYSQNNGYWSLGDAGRCPMCRPDYHGTHFTLGETWFPQSVTSEHSKDLFGRQMFKNSKWTIFCTITNLETWKFPKVYRIIRKNKIHEHHYRLNIHSQTWA